MWRKKVAGKWEFSLEEGEKERIAKVQVLVAAVSQGCSEVEFLGLTCPECRAPLKISVHPDKAVFFISCTSNTRHLAVHDRFSQPQEWHGKHVSYNWLED